MDTTLPDKMYYKIGEVAEVAQVKTSVLRFWESKFSFLKPEKSTTGQRLYSKKEVDLILKVRQLLYVEKYTIEGVRKKISTSGKLKNCSDIQSEHKIVEKSMLLNEVRQELQVIRNML